MICLSFLNEPHSPSCLNLGVCHIYILFHVMHKWISLLHILPSDDTSVALVKRLVKIFGESPQPWPNNCYSHLAICYKETSMSAAPNLLSWYIVWNFARTGGCDQTSLLSLGFYSLRRRRIKGIGITIINPRRSQDRLSFIMGIPPPIRRCLHSE